MKEAIYMAHGDIKVCYVCGAKYEYCEHCVVVKPAYNADRFCSQIHQNIYAILSKHGCNLITADEALTALSAYNLDEITLTEDVLAHIEKIKSEAGVKVEKAVEPEVVAEEPAPIVKETTAQYNKNKKKKW